MIELEREARRVDRDRLHALGRDRRLQRALVALRHVRVRAKVPDRLRVVRLAEPAGLGRVRVVGLALDLAAVVLNDLEEPVVHLAAVVARIDAAEHAVDELLLRERLERAHADRVRRLERRDRRECPARAALALVLHRGHHTVLAPVPALRHVAHVRRRRERRRRFRLAARLPALVAQALLVLLVR
ncbi:hypothetical protein PybrP1_011902 [[Pythium] brassicae (nom. inval.)]|nr:hypothetical protein PybrP1_011902 [[Pythium] brassicae (nom. inval.)]